MNRSKSGFRVRLILFLALIAFNLVLNFTAAGQNQYKGVTQVLESKKKALGGDVCMLIFRDNHLVYEKTLGTLQKTDLMSLPAAVSGLLRHLLRLFLMED